MNPAEESHRRLSARSLLFQQTDYSPTLPPTGGALRHIVCFKFRDDATQEAKDALVAGFAHLPSEIDTIRSFE